MKVILENQGIVGTRWWENSFLWGAVYHLACRILFPEQESNPHPLQWKHRVLTTGLPEKSQQVPVLDRMVREVLAYTSTFEQGFERHEGGNHMNTWRKNILVQNVQKFSERKVAGTAVTVTQSCTTLTPWAVTSQASLSMGFSSKNTGVGCHSLLQGVFPTQESNPGLVHCGQILYFPWSSELPGKKELQ